jgi:hypothetical protein
MEFLPIGLTDSRDANLHLKEHRMTETTILGLVALIIFGGLILAAICLRIRVRGRLSPRGMEIETEERSTETEAKTLPSSNERRQRKLGQSKDRDSR